jgi:hypothetical protein
VGIPAYMSRQFKPVGSKTRDIYLKKYLSDWQREREKEREDTGKSIKQRKRDTNGWIDRDVEIQRSNDTMKERQIERRYTR